MQQTSIPAETMPLVMSADEKAAYVKLLLKDFHVLESLIVGERLEREVRRVGYELELNFLDKDFEPACVGTDVCKSLNDPRFTTEFSRFNLEINSEPAVLAGTCFADMERELEAAMARIQAQAARYDSSVLLTGIIPTLSKAHITPDALTPEPRYQTLYEIRRLLKGELYEYRIQGIDELLTRDNIALFAGSVTSFQIHLQVDPVDLVDSYNWAQLLAGPALASATNSPLFLGKRLWHETRIELFEQATDTRVPDHSGTRNRPRVFFGDKWLDQSVLELLQEDIIAFDPLFRPANVEDPHAALQEGRTPRLDAWTLFNGSIYRWNRLCYGRVQGRPSLRIENRILPSGPTIQDMVANAAFWTGAMAGLPRRYRGVQKRFDFALAKENFFKAARYGLDVRFCWFDGPATARELILDELLPLAEAGLLAAGVDEEDSKRLLGIVRDRTASGRTGAHWMVNSFLELQKGAKPERALRTLTAGMLARQDSGLPVHRWQTVKPNEGGSWLSQFSPVHKVMTTVLYKVKVEDALDLVMHLMQWKNVAHVPVEQESGEFAGIITRTVIMNLMLTPAGIESLKAGEVMTEGNLSITPCTPLKTALQLMQDNSVSYLPVLDDSGIVGLVTEHDLLKVVHGLVVALEQAEAGSRQHVLGH